MYTMQTTDRDTWPRPKRGPEIKLVSDTFTSHATASCRYHSRKARITKTGMKVGWGEGGSGLERTPLVLLQSV